jgi:hypothetical protein
MRKQVANMERLFKLVTHMALDGNFISPRNFIYFCIFEKEILMLTTHTGKQVNIFGFF